MKKTFKLELYVDNELDLKLIVDIIQRFCMFSPEHELNEIKGEFGKMQVEHHHYELRRTGPTPFLPEIELAEEGLAWAYPNHIALGDPVEFFVQLLPIILTHETIHRIIWREEGFGVSQLFDDIFGMFHPSILLMPEDFDFPVREYVERVWNWWRKKTEK